MIELIKRTDGGKVSVAFRFGGEIITKQNLTTHIRNPSTPLAKAVIVGATICRFKSEQELEQEQPRIKRYELEEWKKDEEVQGEINLALKHVPTLDLDSAGGAHSSLKRKDVDFTSSDVIISHGLWRFCVEKGLLGYKLEKKPLPPRFTKFLEVFFKEPGTIFTQEYLTQVLYKRQYVKTDKTLIVMLSTLKSECRMLSGNDELLKSDSSKGTFWI